MLRASFLLLFAYCCTISVNAASLCEPVTYGGGQYGPIDFYDNNSHMEKQGLTGGLKGETSVTIVTKYHFNSNVKYLKRGQTAVHIANDLDYTLRALPNHPEALDTVSRFEVNRNKSASFKQKQKAMPYSADCYFQRAIQVFGHKQPQTYMIWGLHKYRNKKYQEAIELYTKARASGFQNAELEYYLGLAYFKTDNIKKAKLHSDIAYEMGYLLPGLKMLLENKQAN